MTTKPEALVQLCLSVLPIWGRQLGTSRAQSESAVTEMLAAFAALVPQLTQASHQSTAIAYAMGAQGEPVGLRGLAARCQAELAPLFECLDATSAEPLQRVLQLIRDTVARMEEAVTPFPLDAHTVNTSVEQMYVGFQYQDRVNQVMALLQDDMDRLQTSLNSTEDGADALAVDPWLTRLESFYAMAEQHRDHAAQAQTGQPRGTDNEVSFF